MNPKNCEETEYILELDLLTCSYYWVFDIFGEVG